MSRNHEENPSRQNKGEYRRVVELGSASAWGAFDLKVFQVDFEPKSLDTLPSMVLNYTLKDTAKEQTGKEETRIEF